MKWQSLPEPALDGLQGPPDSPSLATPRPDSTCSWCHTGVTLPEVPSSARDLPWLHIIHRLLLCLAVPGRPPLFQFFTEILLLTSDWPHNHCRLVSDLNIHPSAPASSCTAFTPLYTNFLCLLADPLGFEDPPPGFPVTERIRCWLDRLAATACFLCCMCSALSPATPSQPPALACSTPSTTDTATTLDSLDGPPVTSVLMGSPCCVPPATFYVLHFLL
jgi:hypothetical protein